jgi:microcystin-dependent protein
MGNGITSVGLIADAYIDNPATSDKGNVVGATGGDDDIALTTAQMPAHSHDATGVPAWAGPTPPATALKAALKAANHGHPYRVTPEKTEESDPMGGLLLGADGVTGNKVAFTGTPFAGTGAAGTLADSGQQIGGSGDIAITGNTGLTGGTNAVPAGNASAHENMPPFMLVTYLIKL